MNSCRRRWPLPPLLMALLAVALPAAAGNVVIQPGLASDELYRGISQNNGLTLSLRGDCRFDNRFYVGGRVLNQRSAGEVQGDVYAGVSRGLNLFDLLPATIDGGVIASLYGGRSRLPGIEDPDHVDAYGSLLIGPLRLAANLAPDYFGTGGIGYRLSSQLKLPLPIAGLTATGLIGWNAGAGVERFVASRRRPGDGQPYADYLLGLNQELPQSLTAVLQVGGAGIRIDGSRQPTVILGLRWRYGF